MTASGSASRTAAFKSQRWTLALAMVGPVSFMAVLVGASAVAGMRLGNDPAAIAIVVTQQTPILLLIVQVILVAFLLLHRRRHPTAPPWDRGIARTRVEDVLLGVGIGTAVALSYATWLGATLEFLQLRVGDVVPPGEILPTLAAQPVIFFIANVLLAPTVEELLYRGHLQPVIAQRLGPARGIVLSALAFGLLHWMGGIWYMVVTGLLGVLLAGLVHWRGSLVAALAAHQTLNAIEFLVAMRGAHS